jgi:hypothetical protein
MEVYDQQKKRNQRAPYIKKNYQSRLSHQLYRRWLN